ncbi:helix-turn-helix transcriptional regulator [Lentzea sp. PSKA42]|uniref:Helix-turn-helix transcriptional regulator n=1 Tax=Lentzea indica TaxID=2604800 RepID=A0ABX1FI92_9PSEU|nr:helix-turn-helix transcriptional regulator [Lentzea indica]NKE58704.1 helix-turn-helix transcriptional regulator [Lentzea indica]
MRQVELPLSEAPLVADIGVGVHGVTRLEEVFRLPDLWQVHLYVYEGELEVGGTVHRIAPGHASLVPPDTEVRYRYRGRSEHLYAHLRLTGTAERHAAPVMQDAGPNRTLIARLMRGALAAPSARAAAHLWTVLWQLTDAVPAGRGEAADPVAVAAAHVEAHLATSLSVADIAKVAGVSHNHLTRLFRARTGTTVVAYLRRRRMERARHLLTASTLSVTAVAAAVGIPDLQAFNKVCRRELGESPRALRCRHASDHRSMTPLS